MTTLITMNLNGVEALKKVLAELPREHAERVGVAAVRAGAKVIRDEFKASAPVGTGPTDKTRRRKNGQVVKFNYGRLRDNITIKRDKRGAGPHAIKFRIGIGRAFWGMFQEFGTKFQAARPWLRPAFDRSNAAALRVMIESIGKGVAREAAKLNKQYSKAGFKRKK